MSMWKLIRDNKRRNKMPNYSNQIESYRCGDLFKFANNKNIYILSQTTYGAGMLIGLYDGSNRICSHIDGEIATKFNKNYMVVSKIELEEICRSAEIVFGPVRCVGNIKDFKLVNKSDNTNYYDNMVII